MKYHCTNPYSGQQWTGNIFLEVRNDETLEFTVKGKGDTYHLIVGFYSQGVFLVSPKHGVGLILAPLADAHSNSRRLRDFFGLAGSITIANGLRKFVRTDPYFKSHTPERNPVERVPGLSDWLPFNKSMEEIPFL